MNCRQSTEQMTSSKAPNSRRRDDPEQSCRFIEKARQLEADEDRSNADALMGKLARTPPDPKPKPKKTAGTGQTQKR
jgi:hypothetical protein